VTRVALSLAAVVAGLASAGVTLWLLLQPPQLPVPERQDRLFRNVTLVEPGAAPRPGWSVRIADGRIVALVPAGGEAAATDAEETPDLAGLFVAPGLIDMHVHYPPAVAAGNAELWSLLLIAHGVTTIRETGSIDGSIFGVREAIRAGRSIGPRIFACGAMLDGERPSFPSNRVVRTAAEARTAVAEQAARGADCIKAYNMLSREALAGLREEAAAKGLPAIGHAPHDVPLAEVGLRDLQHGTGAVVVDRTRVGRLDFRFEDWDSVDAARIAYAARVYLEQDIAHTPTLWNVRMRDTLVGMARMRADPGDARAAAELAAVVESDSGLRHLPRFWPGLWAALWRPPWAPDDAEGRAARDRFARRLAELTAGLHDAGVRVHAGTDTLMPFVAPGSSLHGELAELVRAGLSPEAAWAAATREAGASLAASRGASSGMSRGEAGLGRLVPGAPADLLFLRADPGRSLRALLEIEAVLADGRLYRRADLETGLRRFDAHFRGRLYEAVMGVLVRLVQDRFAPERDGSESRDAGEVR